MKRRETTLTPIIYDLNPLSEIFNTKKMTEDEWLERDINMKGRIKATSQVYKKFGLTGDPINKLECQHKQK